MLERRVVEPMLFGKMNEWELVFHSNTFQRVGRLLPGGGVSVYLTQRREGAKEMHRTAITSFFYIFS
jgi:hypothetical protein